MQIRKNLRGPEILIQKWVFSYQILLRGVHGELGGPLFPVLLYFLDITPSPPGAPFGIYGLQSYSSEVKIEIT